MAKSDIASETRIAEADTPQGGWVGLYTKDSAEFPAGEWFFKGDDGVEHTLVGPAGAPVTVLTLTDLDDVSEITTRLAAEAGSTDGEGFTLVDSAEQVTNYVWFAATITTNAPYVLPGSAGTFVGIGPRWIDTRTTSGADFNQFRNFYATTAAMKSALPVADWHGVMPAHTHRDDFNNITGQFWSVHQNLYSEFLTSANHSGTMETTLRNGADVSLEVGATEFVIGAGKGFFLDFTDPSGQVDIVLAEWEEFRNESVVLGDFFTSIGLSYNPATGVTTVEKRSAGNFTNTEKLTIIVLGSLNHSNGLTIDDPKMNPLPSYNFKHNMMVWVNAQGGVIDGLEVEYPNANLTWGTAAGTFTLPHVNYTADKMDSTVIPFDQFDPTVFNYNSRNGGGGFDVVQGTVYDPNNWDNGSGPVVPVTSGFWQIQTDFLLGNLNFHVLQYGQAIYQTLQLAKEAINEHTKNLVRNPQLVTFDIVGYVVIQEGHTNNAAGAGIEYVFPIGPETVVIDPESAFPSFESFTIGDYYDQKSQGVSIDAYVAQQMDADTISFSQFRIRTNFDQSFDRIGGEKTAGSGSGVEVRFGIYTDAGNRPDLLVAGSDDGAMSFDTNGSVENNVTISLPPGVYWAATLHSLLSRTYRSMNNVEGETLGVSALGNTDNNYSITAVYSFAALPANTSGLSLSLSTADALRVQLRGA